MYSYIKVKMGQQIGPFVDYQSLNKCLSFVIVTKVMNKSLPFLGFIFMSILEIIVSDKS